MRSVTFILTLLVASATIAQSKFESAILKGKQLIENPDTVTGLQNAANYFQRVAQKETSEWLPLYYQAQVLTFIASRDVDLESKEATLNTALKLIESGKKIEKNSELLALEGFVQMLRLTVDPATRGQTLSPVILGLYQQALAMDSENPRALLFMGQMQYGMAQFFGTGIEESCANVKKAYDIFEKQPDEPTIYPSWGMGSARAALDNCNQ
ncbi:MAG: hypothetical protein CMB80_30680 [Flammeovirgaceae bacterium]|nr:hypothetical protein [Flammeovirgaceae bacterium]MBR07983.1 hypothetical protein [Rickettsiales bacterium]HCX20527.1 hypothetical protein [Cytophagales bacterium]